MFIANKSDLVIGIKQLAVWALLALPLHVLWETAHLPLYTLWDEMDRAKIAAYLLHCALGDMLIATAVFLLTVVVLRDWHWPLRNLGRGGAIMILAGLGYTVFSEFYNVYQLHSWGYRRDMPLVFGIGLTPLLQWFVIPSLMLVFIRRIFRNGHKPKLPI